MHNSFVVIFVILLKNMVFWSLTMKNRIRLGIIDIGPQTYVLIYLNIIQNRFFVFINLVICYYVIFS